jgi:hypothetical protein
MRRRRMLRAQRGHHLLRRRPVRHGLHAADEAALFDQQFAGAVGQDGVLGQVALNFTHENHTATH